VPNRPFFRLKDLLYFKKYIKKVLKKLFAYQQIGFFWIDPCQI